MKKALLFATVAALFLAAACKEAIIPQEEELFEEIEAVIEEEDEEKVIPETRTKATGTVQGTIPESGVPIKAIANGGLAPLTFPGAVKSCLVGYVQSGAKEYPDLFFQCPDGNPESGMYFCSYETKTEDGRPIYNAGVPVSFPWNREATNVKVLSLSGKTVAVVLDGAFLNVYSYNGTSKSFSSTPDKTVSIQGLENNVRGFDIIPGSGNSAELMVLCDDGSDYMPDVPKEHTIYNSANIFIGKLPYARLYTAALNTSTWAPVGNATKITGASDIVVGPAGVTLFSDSSSKGYLVGSCLGGISYYPYDGKSRLTMLADKSGTALDNRCYMTRIMAISNTSFICSGEGPVYLFESSGDHAAGAPVFNAPKQLMMKSGDLFAGTFSVPNVVDWDLDGVLDIVAGTSDGRLAFFRNFGTDEAPAFGEAQYLKANGREVCIRSGYYELNGPLNASYGYLSPTVFDWNQDGVPDIIYSSNATKIEIMLGNGKDDIDCLKAPKVLHMDGMDLWGRWKVRPAITKYNGEIYLIFLDSNDALHLFKKAALTNVRNCGTIKLSDGLTITGHRNISLAGSVTEQGDVKMQLNDWDADGDPDLIIGTTSVASYPDPSGIPYALGTGNMQIMIFENVSDEGFVFEYPRIFQFKKADMFMGAGAKAPVNCDFGDTRRGTNMLVGCDDGKYRFFERHDLSEKQYR